MSSTQPQTFGAILSRDKRGFSGGWLSKVFLSWGPLCSLFLSLSLALALALSPGILYGFCTTWISMFELYRTPRASLISEWFLRNPDTLKQSPTASPKDTGGRMMGERSRRLCQNTSRCLRSPRPRVGCDVSAPSKVSLRVPGFCAGIHALSVVLEPAPPPPDSSPALLHPGRTSVSASPDVTVMDRCHHHGAIC